MILDYFVGHIAEPRSLDCQFRKGLVSSRFHDCPADGRGRAVISLLAAILFVLSLSCAGSGDDGIEFGNRISSVHEKSLRE